VLLDTRVLSELQRPQGSPQVRAQVEALDPEQLYLSVITVGELTKGVARLPASARRRQLSSWLMGLEQRFGELILPIDTEVARRWGELTGRGAVSGGADPSQRRVDRRHRAATRPPCHDAQYPPLRGQWDGHHRPLGDGRLSRRRSTRNRACQG